MSIEFLTYDDVIQIHAHQIATYGGDPGLRDSGLLMSALAMPSSGFSGDYFHAFPAEMAAAYLFHLAKNHPFVDGNKRVGLAAALTFLKLNHIDLIAQPIELEDLTLAVACGNLDKAGIAEFFRSHTQSR